LDKRIVPSEGEKGALNSQEIDEKIPQSLFNLKKTHTFELMEASDISKAQSFKTFPRLNEAQTIFKGNVKKFIVEGCFPKHPPEKITLTLIEEWLEALPNFF